MNYKIIFLICILFFINNASATVIFQENFETQTSGNYTVAGGIPSFVTTPPHGYYLLNDPLDTTDLLKDTLPEFHNFEFEYYVKIDSTNKYNHNTYFYDSIYNQYLYIELDNQPGNQNFFYIDCYDGANYCSGLSINTVNLSLYRDAFSYVKIKIRFVDNVTSLYLNDALITSYSLDFGITTNFTITETFIGQNWPFAFDEITLNTIGTSPATSFNATGTVLFRDMNINSTTYPLNNSLVFINATRFDYTDSSGNYDIGNLDLNLSYTITASKPGFSSESTITSNSDSTNDFLLNFSQPFMTLPHIETGNKILSEYNNTEYPLNLWNSPNFVWGVYRFIEFNGTDKDIDYYKPCNLESDNAFGCELVLNKDYKFRVIYSDLYNYNLGIYHPFLTGSRNFTTGEITISKDYIQIDSIKVISSLPQAQRETTFKGYFWEALFWMFIILLLGFILTGGRNKYGHK